MYTKNTNEDLYVVNAFNTNCGSYALRLNEWYDPEVYLDKIIGDVYDWIENMIIGGYSEEEISSIYGEILVEGMLEEFKGALEICGGRPPETSDKELIVFNTWCRWDDVNGADYDFHFKVFRHNKWMEKRGTTHVRECKLEEWGKYIGEPIYMYHKI